MEGKPAEAQALFAKQLDSVMGFVAGTIPSSKFYETL
jgi:hypothetical protein